ncbi:MAG: phosphoribosyl-ATP pyrophosphatase [Adlercreutzia equolifaciens]
MPLMVNKTFIPEGEAAPASQIGATLEALAATIAARRDADEASYTYRLLTGNVDGVLKKVMEESGEVALAAKDVEGWATSSLAAAVALEAASAGAGDAVSDAEAADEGAGAPLSVQLPPEYGEAVDHLRYEAAGVVYHLLRRAGALRHHARRVRCRAEQSHDRKESGRTVAVRLHDEFVRRGK